MVVPTNVLSFCSGGGGLDLGFRLAVPDARTVCYVENEVTACGVLAKNMAEGGLDDAPIWTDLRTFDGKPWRGVVDCIIGGYPCQPFSNAGKRLGTADPRHLWHDIERIVREVEPLWCFFENVGAHLRLGFREVARSLQSMGYTVAAGLFTAGEVGAPHRRERLFILAANDTSIRVEGCCAPWRSCISGSRWEGCEKDLLAIARHPFNAGYGIPQPIIRVMDDGVAVGLARSDQLHIIGNGVVPQQAALAIVTLARELEESWSS